MWSTRAARCAIDLPHRPSGRRRSGWPARPPRLGLSSHSPSVLGGPFMLVHDSVQTVPSARLRDRDLEASAGHLLRLCLDLQLDALLLTLGALAADRSQD